MGGRSRVLIVGDSISLGFTPVLAEILADEATVERPPQQLFPGGQTNCGDTERGVAELGSWLGDANPYDVVHFNFGLHDICYRRPSTESGGSTHGEWRIFRADRAVAVPHWSQIRLFFHDDKEAGEQSVPLPRYTENMRAIVAQLQDSGARQLVWASTTVVPEREPGRVAGEEAAYNVTSAAAMCWPFVSISSGAAARNGRRSSHVAHPYAHSSADSYAC